MFYSPPSGPPASWVLRLISGCVPLYDMPSPSDQLWKLPEGPLKDWPLPPLNTPSAQADLELYGPALVFKQSSTDEMLENDMANSRSGRAFDLPKWVHKKEQALIHALSERYAPTTEEYLRQEVNLTHRYAASMDRIHQDFGPHGNLAGWSS